MISRLDSENQHDTAESQATGGGFSVRDRMRRIREQMLRGKGAEASPESLTNLTAAVSASSSDREAAVPAGDGPEVVVEHYGAPEGEIVDPEEEARRQAEEDARVAEEEMRRETGARQILEGMRRSDMARRESLLSQDRPVPVRPISLDETGLPEAIVESLLIKILYFRNELIGRELAKAIGLTFSLIEPLLENFKRNHQVAVRKSLGMGNVSALFSLSEAGRELAKQHLETCQYAGPAPVPIDQYSQMVQRQKPKEYWLTTEALTDAFQHMVISRQVLSQLGPAINAGKSLLIYGQPGNGKTYIAESMINIQNTEIFVPYALVSAGQIIQLYDPLYHTKLDTDTDSVFAVQEDQPYDGRWFRSPRPFIQTGGELTLEMLDLAYNPVSKVYDAPLHLKANNGIYLVDDFGRQRVSPAEVLNRWIIPMERRVDYLNLTNAGKIQVPFECFLIFSSNLKPTQLGDEAFLRRIQYKMLLKNPDEKEFMKIFRLVTESFKIAIDDQTLDAFMQKSYRRTNKKFRRCHPRDVITHAVDYIRFEKMEWALTEPVLDHAFDSCFADHGMDE